MLYRLFHFHLKVVQKEADALFFKFFVGGNVIATYSKNRYIQLTKCFKLISEFTGLCGTHSGEVFWVEIEYHCLSCQIFGKGNFFWMR